MSEDNFERKSGHAFGESWETLKAPVKAVIGAMDETGEADIGPRIGLSAMQLTNLGLERLDKMPGGAQGLKRMVMRNTEGLTDDREYPSVVVGLNDKEVIARVYNAFGKLSIGGDLQSECLRSY